MRAIFAKFGTATVALAGLVLVGGVAGGCSSKNSDVASPPADSGGPEGGDTNVADTSPADTKADVKPDTKTDTGGGETTPTSCDPIAQTGCTAPATKCTAVDDGSGKTAAGCVTPTGTKAVGDSCTRASEDPKGIGHDDCAAGMYCSGIGTLETPPNRHCRKFCGDDAKCGSTEKCSILLADGTTPVAGICVPTCTVFGTDCTDGRNCSLIITDMDGKSAYGTCRAVGTAAAGGACKVGNECAKDQICADPTSSGSSTCIPLCDTTHTCATGTCKPIGVPGGAGICQ